MSEPTICADCGRNTEFILHEEGCPEFGREVEQFMKDHQAEIDSWPAGARQAIARLNTMHSVLFGKLLRHQVALQWAKRQLPPSAGLDLDGMLK